MDEMRKKIILNEIHYWKDTRILPEQYCNYLLALYSEGEEEEITSVKRKPIISSIFIALIIVGALIVNYFTENHAAMQITIYLFLICSLVVISIFEYKKNRTLLIPLVAFSFVFVLFTVNLWETFFPKKILFLYIGLLLNCIMWLVVGKVLRLQYFLAAGVLGMFIIGYFVLAYNGLL